MLLPTKILRFSLPEKKNLYPQIFIKFHVLVTFISYKKYRLCWLFYSSAEFKREMGGEKIMASKTMKNENYRFSLYRYVSLSLIAIFHCILSLWLPVNIIFLIFSKRKIELYCRLFRFMRNYSWPTIFWVHIWNHKNLLQ